MDPLGSVEGRRDPGGCGGVEQLGRGRGQSGADVERAAHFGSVQFIAVGTPPDEDGSADLKYVVAAARGIGRHMTDYKVVVDKSTVPVGTADRVKAAIAEELALPPVKIHCSILAEDAIKAAVLDYKTRHGAATQAG